MELPKFIQICASGTGAGTGGSYSSVYGSHQLSALAEDGTVWRYFDGESRKDSGWRKLDKLWEKQ